MIELLLMDDKKFIRKFSINIPNNNLPKLFENYLKIKKKSINDLNKNKKNKFFSDFEEYIVQSASNDLVFSDKNITNITNLNVANFISSSIGKNDLSFELSFSYTKNIDLPDLSELTIEVIDYVPSEKMIEEYIHDLKKKTFDYKDADDKNSKVEINDRITFDGVGYFMINGIKKRFKKGNVQDLEIIVGEGRIISDLEEGLKNMSLSETKQVQVKFPDDYHDIILASKDAFFDVIIKKIKKAIPVDDELFLKKLSKSDISEVKEEVKKMYVSYLLPVKNNSIRDKLYKYLLDKCALHTSDYIIDLEKKKLKSLYKDKKNDDEINSLAIENIKLATLFMNVASINNIKVSDEECKQKIYDMYNGNFHYIKNFMEKSKTNPNVFLELRNEILEEKVFQHIRSSVKLIEKQEIIDSIDEIKKLSDKKEN